MLSLRKIWNYLWPEIRKYKFSFFLVFISYGVGAVLDIIAKPYIYKLVVDTISSGAHTAEILISLEHLAFWFGVIVLVFNMAYRLGDYAGTYFQSKLIKSLHDLAFQKVLAHSYSFFSDNFSGSLVAKAKRLPRAFENLHDIFSYQILFSLISMTGVIIVLFNEAAVLGILFLIWAIIYILIAILFIKKKMKFDLAEAEADSLVTGHLADAFANVINVKVFSQKREEIKNFGMITTTEEGIRRKAWNLANFQSTVQAVLMAILQVAVLYLLIKLWSDGKVTVGTLVLVQAYMLSLFDIIWNLGKSLAKGVKSISEMKEIVDIMELPPEIQDVKRPEKIKIANGDIAFKNTTFGYVDDREVFTNFSLTIPSGQKVGLVGHSGSGKSTFTKLLLRFVDIQKGEITIDGQNIAKIKQDDLRQVISYVPQEPILFHRTIRENIKYSKPSATDEEMIIAAKKAHAHEFIEGLPSGYDTLVGERGVKLSGGERQRVAIARAMLKDSPILLLDEATSSLDSISESYIQTAFDELMKGRTTIVIAHRLSTIQKMDRIIVLDKGVIMEEGTHRELIEKDSVYANLWKHQTDGFIE